MHLQLLLLLLGGHKKHAVHVRLLVEVLSTCPFEANHLLLSRAHRRKKLLVRHRLGLWLEFLKL